jgi:hypothetical protein
MHCVFVDLLEQPDKFLAKTVQTTEASPMPDKATYTVYLFNGARQPTSFYAELDVLRQAAQAGGAERMPRFFSINDAMDDPGSDHIVAFVRDSLLAIFPSRSAFESDSASLGLNLPDPNPTKQCPDDYFACAPVLNHLAPRRSRICHRNQLSTIDTMRSV